MLLQLCTGYVEGYDEGQDPIIYLVSTAQAISHAHIPFVFSDGHGIMAVTGWYSDLSELKNIDWEAIYAKYWHDTDEDPDRQRRKQAEFLIFHFCPWAMVTEIGVINNDIKIKVEGILYKHNIPTPVRIHREWYY